VWLCSEMCGYLCVCVCVYVCVCVCVCLCVGTDASLVGVLCAVRRIRGAACK